MIHDKDDPTMLDVQDVKPHPRTSPPFEVGNGCIYVKFVHPLKLKAHS